MTSQALDGSFYSSAFCAPRSVFKNRKLLVALARVNHTDKCGFLHPPVRCAADGRNLKPDSLFERAASY
jgi:hypothetical protein